MSALLTTLNTYKSNIKEMMYDLVDDLIDIENQIKKSKTSTFKTTYWKRSIHGL